MNKIYTLSRRSVSPDRSAVFGLLSTGIDKFHTLENKSKIIPSGTYELLLTYSPKFRRPLPLVSGVKDRLGIRIHSGNTAKDSSGCILVGRWNAFSPNSICNSRDSLELFQLRLINDIDLYDKVLINIIDDYEQ